IAQRDASSIVLHSALSAEEQDEDDPIHNILTHFISCAFHFKCREYSHYW
ncbi:hypothetical protein ACUN9W_10360, partial [Escherichia coli]